MNLRLICMIVRGGVGCTPTSGQGVVWVFVNRHGPRTVIRNCQVRTECV